MTTPSDIGFATGRALVNRGRLTLWVDQDAIAAWRYTGPSDGRGRPRVYADAAIECALVLKSVFHLSLRTTQGFLESGVTLIALDLPVPDYSTVSRRQTWRPLGALLSKRQKYQRQIE